MNQSGQTIFNALIRTHHITSRRKVAGLKKATHRAANFVVIRSGGCPGLMYVEGSEKGVQTWIAAVHALRYKDCQVLRRSAPVEREGSAEGSQEEQETGFYEVGSTSRFEERLRKRGVVRWWRTAMGYPDRDG